MELSNLTFEQLRLIIVVYSSSIIPLIIIPYLTYKNKIPKWVIKLYVLMFLICAFGWELWFTYGWVDGSCVNLRRADILSYYIPININWLLNSLGDAGAICLGGLFITHKIYKNDSFIHKWDWKAFSILLFIFLLQNILVEVYLYHDQLAEGKPLSWAPLSPLGNMFNPMLLTLSDRTVMFQSQVPWLITTPIFYKLLLYLNKDK